jgi:hypothetical protein
VTLAAALASAGTVTFAADRTELVGPSAATVERVARLLGAGPGPRIALTGYAADAPGPAAVAQRLSEQRSAVVADALVAAGVDRDRLVTTGRGVADPLATPEQARRSAQEETLAWLFAQMWMLELAVPLGRRAAGWRSSALPSRAAAQAPPPGWVPEAAPAEPDPTPPTRPADPLASPALAEPTRTPGRPAQRAARAARLTDDHDVAAAGDPGTGRPFEPADSRHSRGCSVRLSSPSRCRDR